MQNILVVVLIIRYYFCLGVEGSNKILTKFITKRGYPLEVHRVETEDGYILNLYRIPYGRTNVTAAGSPPVLLNHGLAGTAENYVWLDPSRSLGFVLADRGYDVWLFCARGTWHSTRHKTLDPERDKAYWQFTWHEIGVYDLPASIDHILLTTNKTSLHYVGHSQGCTSMFAMASDRPEYNDKIKVMVALAPAVLLHDVRSPVGLAIPIYKLLRVITDSLSIYKLVPFMSHSAAIALFHAFCRSRPTLCETILFFVNGRERRQYMREFTTTFASAIPGGSSVAQLYHYAQVQNSREFGRYDWGESLNLQKYGSKVPGRYRIENVSFPVALYYGKHDMFICLKDIEYLKKVLPNVVHAHMVLDDDWTHNDFVWARDVKTLLNDNVLEIMDKFK